MDESLSSLGDQICQHFVQSRFDERSPSFLPDGCIKGLISEGAISNELFDEDDDPQTAEKALIRFVKDKAKKVFAITVDNLPAHVAIKEILVNNNLRHEIEKNYEDERKAFSEITDLRHSHIIQRIAAITRGEKRQLPSRRLEAGNILRFRDSTCVGVLKIADMGLAKHHNDAKAGRKKATSAKYGAVRSRLYDIWSMGCIMLECVIWLMYGYEALDNLDDSLNDGYDSSFFKTKNVDGARVV
ncbi:tryptophanyl-tRNA synthetase [Colletotrichum acutatum]